MYAGTLIMFRKSKITPFSEFLNALIKILKSWKTTRTDGDQVLGQGPTGTELKQVPDYATMLVCHIYLRNAKHEITRPTQYVLMSR